MARANQYLPAGVPGRCWLRSDRRVVATTPRSHSELVALFAIRGIVRYFIDDRILTLGPGSLLWAHTDHSHFLIAESPDSEVWVLVIAPWVLRPARLYPPRLAADTGWPPHARVLGEDTAAELGAVAAKLRRTNDPGLLSVGLRWWVASAWAAWQQADREKGQRVHAAVRRAADLLRADMDMPLDDVARQAGLSLSRLRNIFRAETGLGLVEFRTERRLQRIDAIMARGARPLLAAALDAGFGSYSQFYRAFTAARGRSPREYYAIDTAGGAAPGEHSSLRS